MTARFAPGTMRSGDEDIYYECSGEGDALVLCHGLGGNHAIWFQQVPVFAESFRVVAWDQRGFGMSTNTTGAAGPSAASTDIGALLDHLEIDRAHLVGQSMGGWAVVGSALRTPERVASLTICDSPAGVWTDAMADIYRSHRRPESDHSVIGGHSAVGDDLRRRDPAKAFLYQEIGGFRAGIDDAAMTSLLVTTRYPLDDVSHLQMPVLLIVGAEDPIVPPGVVREVACVLGDAPVVEIPAAGHSPYFEQPDAWNAAVMSFLKSIGPLC
jgi:2-succinyl-6-hydroxy-2,4-cyclohexadiene-1-carboxylate synthase